jgi:release factor glutamine methyltransferase
MTIKEALQEGSQRLKNGKEARILLSHYLQKDILSLILIEQEILTNHEGYFALIERAKENEPIEYITQKVSFYSEEFFIKKGALIPRPETEILIDKVLQEVKGYKKPNILEIGVGSGVISIMIAYLLKEVEITATDISKEALEIATINTKAFGVEDKITFHHTPYQEGIEKHFDIIISNPPYIANGTSLEKNLSYEPDIALFGGENGDEVLKKVIDIAYQQSPTILCCEMGYDQKESLSEYMKDKGIFDIKFYKDFSGFDRGFIAKIGEEHRK